MAAYMVTTAGARRPVYDACLLCWDVCKAANLEWTPLVTKVNTNINEKTAFVYARSIHTGATKRTFAPEDVENVEHHGCTVQARMPQWTESRIVESTGIEASRLDAPWLTLWDQDGKQMKVLPLKDPSRPKYEVRFFCAKLSAMRKSESASAAQLRADQGKEVFATLGKEMAKKGCALASMLTLDQVDRLAEVVKLQDRQAILGETMSVHRGGGGEDRRRRRR